jgi:hypothetical protein
MAKKKTSTKKPAKSSSKKAPKAPGAAVAPTTEGTKRRRLKESRYSSFRLQKRIKPSQPAVLGGFKIFKQAVALLWRNWKVFLGIMVIYAILNVILVQSFSNLNVHDSKSTLEEIFSGQWSKVVSGFSIFAYLIGHSTATGSQTAGTYQFLLILLTSLASIWAVRHAYAGTKVRVRDAFYRGMYPLVPFVLVFAVVVIQLLPVIVGSFLYSYAGSGGAMTGVELILWVMAVLALTMLSLYMICSSLFALYIVCLPDMAPAIALRSARELVANRRWLIMRRVLFLPLILLVTGALIMLPVIIIVPPAAVGLFFAMTVVTIPLIHAYMYRLYRELL